MSASKAALHPAPIRTAHDEPFWEAAGRGVLLIKACIRCDRTHWYPRAHCPLCGSTDTVWREASGRGTIYSFSIVPRSKRPTAVCIVELDEGPKVTTIIVDSDIHAMRLEDPVRVRFEPAEDGSSIPVFTTKAAEEARAYAMRTDEASLNVADVLGTTPLPIKSAAVIGAGSMGIGITKALLSGGLPVQLIEPDDAARERAAADLATYVSRKLEQGSNPFPSIELSGDLDDASDADVVIEAVWEDFAVKKDVLVTLDRVLKPSAILATNTSTLDINLLAASTTNPGRVLGMHFFSPAHVMCLVEIVRGQATDSTILASSIALAQRLGKTPVVVGVCHGFAANRMMIARNQEAEQLLLEGSTPEQVDRVMREMGLPMGPFEMLDMAGGIEVNVRRRQASGEPNWLIDALYKRGRLGQKSGRGFYRYQDDDRIPRPDPEVNSLIEQASEQAGLVRRRIPDSEVRRRLLDRLAGEGHAIAAEGVVARIGDLDVMWRHGFGWPDWSGGPMYAAGRAGEM